MRSVLSCCMGKKKFQCQILHSYNSQVSNKISVIKIKKKIRKFFSLVDYHDDFELLMMYILISTFSFSICECRQYSFSFWWCSKINYHYKYYIYSSFNHPVLTQKGNRIDIINVNQDLFTNKSYLHQNFIHCPWLFHLLMKIFVF